MREYLVKATATATNRSCLCKVEVAFLVRLEVEGELVEAGSDEDVVIKALVKICFAIVVEIVEAGELVASVGVNDVVDNLKTKSLEKSAGESTPGDPGEVTVDTLGDPNVTVPGRAGGALAIGEKVEGPESNVGFPRVVLGERDVIDGVAFGVLAGASLGFDDLREE